MGYVDIHAHIIPGIDDGSKNNEESVAMLKQAYAAGITTVVATPHLFKGFSDYRNEDIRKYCKALEKHAKKHIAPEFRIVSGQEIFYREQSLEWIRQGKVLPIGESNYILIEFEPGIRYSAMFQALREVTMTSFFPILAHIEVYDCLREKGRVEEVRALGVLMQMNYYHIGGKWHDKTAMWCRSMLKQGMVDMLGTDMHNKTDRGPRTEKALAWIHKSLDEEYVEELTFRNASRLLGLAEQPEKDKEAPKAEQPAREEAKTADCTDAKAADKPAAQITQEERKGEDKS